MSDLLCPFTTPLVKKDFACQYADEVIRRGGAEIVCKQMASHSVCGQLHSQIKLAALAAMDLEDDLLSLPHNVLVKIQYGGLLGLQALAQPDLKQTEHIENIDALVKKAESMFNALSNIPLETVSEAVINFKVQRRRKK